MTNLKRDIASIFIVFSLVFLPLVAGAQLFDPYSPPPTTDGTLPNAGQQVQPPPNTGQFSPNANAVTIQNPLGNIKDFPTLIKKLFDALLPIGVSIAVLFIVWAGFKFVWAQGKPEELKQARNNFLWTIIGIGIFLAAWSIANVVWNTIKGLQGSNSPF